MKTSAEIITEAMTACSFSAHQLAKETGVPESYLSAFLKGDFHRLPSAPYVRGYIKKIAAILKIDENNLWDVHQKETSLRASGPLDSLPGNRFAIKRPRIGYWLWSGIVLAALIIYIVIQGGNITGIPKIVLENPVTEFTVVKEPSIDVRGTVSAKDSVLLNGEPLIVLGGRFERTHSLESGLNVLTITAKRFLGREAKIVRQVVYESIVVGVPESVGR